MITVTRHRRVEVRLSEEQFEKLNAAVYRSGLSREEYLRSLIQKLVPSDKPSPDFVETIKQLRMIGNNLNQIAVVAHRIGLIDKAKYQKNMDDLHEQIKYLIQINQEYRKLEEQE